MLKAWAAEEKSRKEDRNKRRGGGKEDLGPIFSDAPAITGGTSGPLYTEGRCFYARDKA